MVPKLRFKEFCGEWEEKRLGDVAEIYKGNTLSKSDLRDEGYPCILYGELYTKYGEIIERVYSKTNRADKNLFIGKNNDVLIPSSGETAIDISTASCLKCDNVYIGGDLNVIRCNDINGSFLSYNLNHKQKNSIAKFAQGVSVVHIYGNSLRKLKIKIPSLPEQTKIADFLSTVDDKIQNQQDKITHLENIKKGFMQKIFSRKIRFKDDGGEEFLEWEEKKLGDVIEYITDYVAAGSFADIRKNVTYLDTGYAQLIRTIDLKNNFRNSEFVYVDKHAFEYLHKVNLNEDSIILPNIGANIGESYYITPDMLPNKYNVLAPNAILLRSKVQNNKFIYQFFKTTIFINKLKLIVGASGQPKFNKTDLKNLKIELPCLKEQQKIADFLSSFDEKISTEKETLEHLKQLKKGLLQQMFV